MAVTVREVLKHYKIPIEKEMGNELRCKCPFHNDSNPSLDFNENKAQWICRAGCGGGNIVEFIKRMENVSYVEAKKLYDNNFSLRKVDDLTVIDNIISDIEFSSDLDTIIELDLLAKKAFVNTVLTSLSYVPIDNYDVFRNWFWILIYIESSETLTRSEYFNLLYEFSTDIKNIRKENKICDK